jgi:ferredoxin
MLPWRIEVIGLRRIFWGSFTSMTNVLVMICVAIWYQIFWYGIGGRFFCEKQPIKPEAIEMCQEAMAGCPVEAIGDDEKSGKE